MVGQLFAKNPLDRGVIALGDIREIGKVVPRKLVVHEDADAPRIVLHLRSHVPRAFAKFSRKFRMAGVGQRSPPALRTGEAGSSTCRKAYGVGRAPREIHFRLRPVADRIDAPRLETTMRKVHGCLTPITAIFALHIRRREIVCRVRQVVRFGIKAMRGPPPCLAIKRPKRAITLRRKPLKIPLAKTDARRPFANVQTVDAKRPEETPPGIHKPPFPIDLLHTEKTRRFQLRPFRPATIFVAVGVWPRRIRREPLRFFFPCPCEVGLHMDLARPVDVLELSEPVDERQKPIRLENDLFAFLIEGLDRKNLEVVGRLSFTAKNMNT